jgi:catechol 2,3-dioxygenase-like lactoylglutathione lyase family enzyme
MSLIDSLRETKTAHVPAPRAVPHPREYAHVVLKTAQPDRMIDWYCKVLGMSVVMRTPIINFLTWDGSQDRLAILSVQPGVTPRGEKSNLHHVAFTYDRLADTVAVFRMLQREGIAPHWCVNHGPTTSFYYHDPDGNSIELSVDHFSDAASLNAWLETGAFNLNPIGVTLDPEWLAARVESGEPEADILRPNPQHGALLQLELDRRAKPQAASAS